MNVVVNLKIPIHVKLYLVLLKWISIYWEDFLLHVGNLVFGNNVGKQKNNEAKAEGYFSGIVYQFTNSNLN